MRKIRLGGMLISLVLVVATLTGHAFDRSTRTAEASVPTFDESPCPEDVLAVSEGIDLTCGYLIVPENRSNPSGPTIRNFVTIAKPDGVAPPDPVFSPGRDLATAPFQVDAPGPFFGRVEIQMHQRGTGHSEPSLDCPGSDKYPIRRRASSSAARRCRPRSLTPSRRVTTG